MELYNLLLHILEEYLHFAVMGERTDPDHTVVGGVEKVQGICRMFCQVPIISSGRMG